MKEDGGESAVEVGPLAEGSEAVPGRPSRPGGADRGPASDDSSDPEEPSGNWISRFGSRNHPATQARKARLQKARAGQVPSEDTVASYTAARAFLYGEWFGACVAVASFTLLYMFGFGAPDVPARVSLPVCLGMLALGAFVFMRNRSYYERLGFAWAKRWHNTALVVAGAAGIFWLLFGMLVLLAGLDVAIAPPK